MTTTLNNGIEMPLVGFGTYQITDPGECEHSVLTAIESGYRLIDTAQNYGNERAVGSAVRSCGVARKELFITSKVWFRNHKEGECRASVMRSLERLGLDYIDLMLIHWPFGDVYAAWRDLEALYKEGVLRAIGVSNFSPDRLVDLINFNQVVPAVNQVETHLYCQQKEGHEWMGKYKVLHQAYAPPGTEPDQRYVPPAPSPGGGQGSRQDPGPGGPAVSGPAGHFGHSQVGTPGAHSGEHRRVRL